MIISFSLCNSSRLGLSHSIKMSYSSSGSASELGWRKENQVFDDANSPRLSSIDSEYCARSDSVVNVRGTEKPGKMAAGFSSCPSPEVRYKIEKASAESTKYMALRMYESMKMHGLRVDEANKAFGREDREIEEVKEEEVEVRKKSEERMGMEYLMKDGFVSYLHDMSRITPPIPQQG